MFKKMMIRVALSRQFKGMPKEAMDRLVDAVEQNPGFFKGMDAEIKERVKKGEDKMFAARAVAMKHQGELQKILQGR